MRQDDIDLICKWMEWEKRPFIPNTDAPVELWVKDKWAMAWIAGFDPFTNPADCARVMDAVVRRGWWFMVHSPFVDDAPYFAGLTPKGVTGWNGRPDEPGEGATECEAKMNAVLAMVKEGK